jgi:Ras-related protein Rab-18
LLNKIINNLNHHRNNDPKSTDIKKRGMEQIVLKIVLVGDSCTGKSTFLESYIDNYHFSENPVPTIGVDFRVKELIVENKKLKIRVWDTAGQERYRGLCRGYYKDVAGTIFMYDLTRTESRENLRTWKKEADECFKLYNPHNQVPFVMIGNKMDLIKEEEKDDLIKECKEFTNSFKTDLILCSSKVKYNEYNVDIGMIVLINKILKGIENKTLILPEKEYHIVLTEKNIDNTEDCTC